MGEYAQYGYNNVKIGTCENMYYLRADQRHQVRKVANSLDVNACLDSIRFRFPFPDEDGVSPGGFNDPDRGIFIGLPVPAGVDHYSIQFAAQPGYLVSLPCPEAGPVDGYKVHRNGFPGGWAVVQQAYRGGHLATVCRCNCGARFWLDLEEAEKVAAYFDEGQPVVAARIRAGYARPAAS